jgi:hypothetical protein
MQLHSLRNLLMLAPSCPSSPKTFFLSLCALNHHCAQAHPPPRPPPPAPNILPPDTNHSSLFSLSTLLLLFLYHSYVCWKPPPWWPKYHDTITLIMHLQVQLLFPPTRAIRILWSAWAFSLRLGANKVHLVDLAVGILAIITNY